MRNKKAKVNPVSAFVTAPGSREHVIYESRFDGQTIKLVATGKEDVQKKIEAFAPFTDLNYMLSRLKVGDDSVVTQRTALYGDFSAMPVNPIDAVNLVRSAEQRFARLSAEEKKACNNDYRVWLARTIMGSSIEQPAGASDPEPAALTEKEE